MPFNFELTISGLCVIVLKAQIDRPPNPTAVDILCVGAHFHRPLLSYPPEYVKPAKRLEPELFVDPKGVRIAGLDITGSSLALSFASGPTTFTLDWGDSTKVTPPTPAAEAWMQWVPSVGDLGLDKVRIGKPGQLDHGIGARLSLPPGKISARNVVKDKDGKYGVWKFPAHGGKRAVANEVVYRAEGVSHAKITWDDHKLEYSREADLNMCLSGDMAVVPSNYTAEHKKLHHLMHLVGMADPVKEVKVPELEEFQRTGRPICNQVYFVDKS